MPRLIRHCALIKPLDYVIFLLLFISVVASFQIWSGAHQAMRVRIYQEGQLYQEIDLWVQKNIAVQGPLGITIIEIAAGKARIAADPSPRQYCVQQGWLDKAGQLAICLPNHISMMIIGRSHEVAYDSLNY